ncbi:MAG: hypothetical protein KA764_21690 [Anaerolineales bacterium]|nr:hypothetical protein [Anaerolineales bacterium]
MTLTSPLSVRWVVDAGQVLVVDERRGTVHCLRGVEMAVWNWLTLAYPYPRLVVLLAESLAVSPAAAEAQLAALLRGWQAAGVLEVQEPAHG